MNIKAIDQQRLIGNIAAVVNDEVFRGTSGPMSAKYVVERGELVALIMGHITAAVTNLDPDAPQVDPERAVEIMRESLMAGYREVIKPVGVA